LRGNPCRMESQWFSRVRG